MCECFVNVYTPSLLTLDSSEFFTNAESNAFLKIYSNMRSECHASKGNGEGLGLLELNVGFGWCFNIKSFVVI